MMLITRALARPLLGLVLIGCLVLGGTSRVATQTRLSSEHGRPSLVQHAIAPSLTDPRIDRALDDHLTWFDRSVISNHKLFVFLPGTFATPSFYTLIQREAAHLGYHVIGLMYVNDTPLARLCPVQPDPEACYENVRLEIISGSPQTGLVDVNEANGIVNRLHQLLGYLAKTYPSEGWAQFLEDGVPVWPHISVGGHSQGAGHAAMIGKLTLTDRVLMFSGVPDGIGAAAQWVKIGATSADHYYGLAHDADGFFPVISANWTALGLDQFGPPRAPETTAPPYHWTHRLVTDLATVDDDPHNGTVMDFITPIGPDGTPLLRDAWDYMLGGRSTRP